MSRPRFGAVGVTWTGATPAGTAVEVRLREKGSWSGWQALPPSDGGGPDQGTAEARSAVHGTEPLLTDGADGVQVRVSSRSGVAPGGLKVQTVDPGTAPADNAPAVAPSSFAASPAAFVTPAATVGGAVRPTIITRAQWGAVESLRRCAPAYLTKPLKAAVLHHTAGSNAYTAASAAAEIQLRLRLPHPGPWAGATSATTSWWTVSAGSTRAAPAGWTGWSRAPTRSGSTARPSGSRHSATSTWPSRRP